MLRLVVTFFPKLPLTTDRDAPAAAKALGAALAATRLLLISDNMFILCLSMLFYACDLWDTGLRPIKSRRPVSHQRSHHSHQPEDPACTRPASCTSTNFYRQTQRKGPPPLFAAATPSRRLGEIDAAVSIYSHSRGAEGRRSLQIPAHPQQKRQPPWRTPSHPLAPTCPGLLLLRWSMRSRPILSAGQ